MRSVQGQIKELEEILKRALAAEADSTAYFLEREILKLKALLRA